MLVIRIKPLFLLIFIFTLTTLNSENVKISDIRNNLDRYIDRYVTIKGIVTDKFDILFFSNDLYKIMDATGEIWILSDIGLPPLRKEVIVSGYTKKIFENRLDGLFLNLGNNVYSALNLSNDIMFVQYKFNYSEDDVKDELNGSESPEKITFVTMENETNRDTEEILRFKIRAISGDNLHIDISNNNISLPYGTECKVIRLDGKNEIIITTGYVIICLTNIMILSFDMSILTSDILITDLVEIRFGNGS